MRIDLFATNVFQRLVLLDLNWISFFEIEREIESELHPCLKILHFFFGGGGASCIETFTYGISENYLGFCFFTMMMMIVFRKWVNQ